MTQTETPRGRRRGGRAARLVLVAQATLLAALLAVGLLWIDLSRVGRAIAALSAGALVAYVLLMVSTRAISALRWYLVATRHVGLVGVPPLFFLRTELLAEFATLWLQTFVGGEAVRIWQVARRSGRRALAVASVALDRAVGTVVLVTVCVPFLLPLRGEAAGARLPEALWTVAAASAALALLVAVGFRTLPALRSLAVRGWRGILGRRLPVVPLLVGFTVYPVTVLAHWIAFPELADRGWIVTATVALVPRLGRAVPLSVFGVSAVEGSTLLLGPWLGIGAETLVVVAGLNLLVKYVSGGLGGVAELVVNGTRFFEDVRRPRPAEAEDLAERALAGRDGDEA